MSKRDLEAEIDELKELVGPFEKDVENLGHMIDIVRLMQKRQENQARLIERLIDLVEKLSIKVEALQNSSKTAPVDLENVSDFVETSRLVIESERKIIKEFREPSE
ncbi:hypothetical protein [Arcanobacterium phocae]|uniref:hypothetical protein n=1 Tax=Arcanobacterium phocae TaxID=131112 RepID=UPI001C0F1F7B|nr:hypothetical protein [Arcanobacterium phocae]